MPSAQLLLGRFQRERLRRLVVEHLSALHCLGAVGHGVHELGYLLVLLGELVDERGESRYVRVYLDCDLPEGLEVSRRD